MAKRSPALAAVGWTLGILFMPFMGTFLVFWYLIEFGSFGVFMFPYRLIRRGQRKNLHTQQTVLATQQAMLRQMARQQQATPGNRVGTCHRYRRPPHKRSLRLHPANKERRVAELKGLSYGSLD
jgi:hypothetical protein